jgi:hypothetical protein
MTRGSRCVPDLLEAALHEPSHDLVHGISHLQANDDGFARGIRLTRGSGAEIRVAHETAMSCTSEGRYGR